MKKENQCGIFQNLFKNKSVKEAIETGGQDSMKIVIVNRDELDGMLCSEIKQEICEQDQTSWKVVAGLINREAAKKVAISNVYYRATDQEDEYIEITNRGILVADISGWKINAGNRKQDFVFPAETVLFPQKTVRVYTKPNEQNPNQLNFGKKTAIWNNKGDVGALYDAYDKPVSGWAYGGKAISFVLITDIFYDGKKKGVETDEYIEISNTAEIHLDISRWKIEAGKNQTYTFPEKTALFPKQSIRVYTNEVHPETGGFSFGINRSIWNNKGDKGILSDAEGNTVSTFQYGD